MKAWEFFDEVYEGYISEFDMLNMVEDMTDQYDPVKLNLICEEFDFYFFMKKEEFEGSFSHDEIKNKMHELEKSGKKIPMLSDKEFKPFYVSEFFESKNNFVKKKSLTEEQKKELEKKRVKRKADWEEKKKLILDVNKLMDPHGIEFYSLYRLRDILIHLKRKHTNAVYKFDDKEPLVINIQPIHWLKEEESLRQFIDELISAGLIEKRETKDIILEHFVVDGQMPTKEPEPIIWKGKKVLLAHLINNLDSINAIKADHIWKVTAPHFEWNGKIPEGLRQSANSNPYPNNIELIEKIIKKVKQSN